MDPRTLSTASQLGEVLGLHMSATLQKPIAMHALRRELRRVMHESQPVTTVRLAAAIESGKIRPHYQPQVTRDEDGGWSITEVEALARWHQPDGTVLMPDNFIGLADENDLLKSLTDSMLNQVVEQISRWNKKGIRLRAAVNLSPSLLTDSEFPDELERLMQRHEVDNRQLVLEVTEHVVIEYSASTIEVLGRLRVKNFGLAIDDFGTGYSSLEQLYRMPFDKIKIDRSFIKRAVSSKDMRIIIEAIVLPGHKLGMSVCAEGVETQSAFDFLASTGCDQQQGFLIGRPVSASELTSRLDQSDDVAPPILAIG
jgi:EAL domain-containing protein (putative c-di-GMP-specific phosphodiesterase class I)